MKPTVDAIANWFGRDGEVIDRVAAELAGCGWIGVPFAGGMGALAKLKCKQGVANDLHRHVVNLAMVIGSPEHREKLIEFLDAMPQSEAAYEQAKEHCRSTSLDQGEYQILDAAMYFIVSWMGRGGMAGTSREFANGGFSFRWKLTGGSSSSRWRSAVESIPAWGDVLRRWSFTCRDANDFLKSCNDDPDTGIYCDSPFPGAGAKYAHNMGCGTDAERGQLEKLRDSLLRFKRARVVVRYYDHPVIRELYPYTRWNWIAMSGRNQSNAARDEVLIVNGD